MAAPHNTASAPQAAQAPEAFCAPRVFSLLKQLFGKQQLSSLMDYIQGSIMLNYNDRAL